MSPVMMKSIGAVVLALGVMLAASASVQFGESDYQQATAAGQQTFTEAAVAESAVVPAAQRLSEWRAAHLVMLLAGLILIITGAVMARLADARHREISLTASGGNDWGETLQRLKGDTSRFLLELENPDTRLDQVREQINHVRQSVLEPLIASRHELEIRLGLAAYAAVLGPLSGFERAFNRAWTALADHHRAEATASLELAIVQLNEAEKALQESAAK